MQPGLELLPDTTLILALRFPLGRKTNKKHKTNKKTPTNYYHFTVILDLIFVSI